MRFFSIFTIVFVLAFSFANFRCAAGMESTDASSMPDDHEEDESMMSAPAGGDTPPLAGSYASLGDEVRELIRPRCGSCHTSSLPTAKPGAVKVFDLVHDRWAATMSEDELDSFASRLKNLPEAQRARVQRFVLEEKAGRHAQ